LTTACVEGMDILEGSGDGGLEALFSPNSRLKSPFALFSSDMSRRCVSKKMRGPQRNKEANCYKRVRSHLTRWRQAIGKVAASRTRGADELTASREEAYKAV